MSSSEYGLKVKHCRDGAASMTFVKSIAEKIDDSLDASGNNVYHKLISKPEKDILLIFNMGQPCTDLRLPIGDLLSSKVITKSADKIGHMGKGSFAAVWNLAPDNMLLCSTNTVRRTELSFNSGQYLRKIDEVEKNKGNMVGPELNPSNFYTNGFMSEDTSRLLKSFVSEIDNSSMKAALTRIADGTTMDYFLIALEFPKDHRLFRKISSQFTRAMSSYKLYYSRILRSRNDSSIVFEDSRLKPDTISPSIKVDSTNSVDLFAGETCLNADVEVRNTFIEKNDNGTIHKVIDQVVFKVTWSVDGHPEKLVRFITNRPTNKKIKDSAQVLIKEPSNWAKLNILGSGLSAKLTCLSKNQDDIQLSQISGEYDKCEMMRGISVFWNDRQLGPPWWKDSWGALRNTGPIRAALFMNSNKELIKVANLQTDKSAINLSEAHPCISLLLDELMGYAKTFGSNYKTAEQKADDMWKPSITPQSAFPYLLGKGNGKKPSKPNQVALGTTTPVLPRVAIQGNPIVSTTVPVTEITAAVTQVAGHTRETPKSRADIVRMLKALAEKLDELELVSIANTDRFDLLISETSNDTENGLVNVWKSTRDLIDWVEENIVLE